MASDAERWMYGWKAGRMDERIDGWMDETITGRLPMDAWMDGLSN